MSSCEISLDNKDIITMEYKLTGSLEQLTTKTPPKSLKIRTFSIEEQEEQEAASGTHDKRVGTTPASCSKQSSDMHFIAEFRVLNLRKD